MLNDCDVCGEVVHVPLVSGVSSVYDRQHLYLIAKCSICGIAYTLPRTSFKDLVSLYEKTYSYEVHDLVSLEKRRRARGLIKSLSINLSGKKVAEIGTGTGSLLFVAQKLGADVMGCEIDKKSCIKANSSLQAELVKNATAEVFLEELVLEQDIVVMSHVLEHLMDPVQILQSIRRKLTDNGCLIIVVPNLMAAPRWRLRKYWGYWQVPVHRAHYDLNGLHCLLKKSGFEIQSSATRASDLMSLGLFVANLLRLDNSNLQPGKVTAVGLRGLSWLWSWTYRMGNQDLIVRANPVNVAES